MKVLLIEDQRNFAYVVQDVFLRDGNFTVEWLDRLDLGIARLAQWQPEVILLDLTLPDSRGIDSVVRLQEHATGIPIIVLTGTDDEQLAIEAVRCGAQDYLVKGDFDKRALMRAIHYAVERKNSEHRLRFERQKQAALREINLANSSALNLWSVLNTLVDQVNALLPDFATAIWIYSEATGRSEPFARWKMDQADWRAIADRQPLGIPDAAFQSHQPTVLTDLKTALSAGGTAARADAGLRSFIGIPLISENQLLGLLGFFSKRPYEPSRDEIEFLTAIAAQAALAIGNSRLRVQSREQAIDLERANMEIRKTEHKYRELVESINAIVWEADPVTWRFTFVSKAAENILGYPIERWLHADDFWVNLIHPDDRSRAVDYCRRQTEQGNNHEFEYRAIALDGRIVWLRDMVRVIKNESGRPIVLRGAMIDITQSKNAAGNLQRHHDQIQTLQEISRIILEAEAPNAGIEKALEKSIAACGFDFGDVLLTTPQGELVSVAAAWGFNDPANLQRTRRSESSTHRREHLQQFLIMQNIQSGDRFRSLRREGAETLMVVPLRTGNESLGLLQLASRSTKEIRPDELALAETLGRQIGIAIQKTNLTAELQTNLRRIQALYEVNLAITSTLDLRAVLDALLERMEFFVGQGAAITIQLIDSETGCFEYFANHNLNQKVWTQQYGKQRPISESGLARLALESLAPLEVFDLQTDPRVRHPAFMRKQGLVSYLGVPLRIKDKPVGIIGIFTRIPRQFSTEEINYISSLASQTAIAIHNARLYTEVEKKSQELAALFEVASAASRSLEMQRILDEVVGRITQIFDFDATRIFLIDEEKKELRLRSSSEAEPKSLGRTERFKLGQGITGKVAASGEAIVVGDIQNDPLYDELSLTKVTRNAGQRFIAGFPISYQRETLGVIMCMGRNARKLSAHEMQLINSMSSQVAIALKNARLYEETKRNLERIQALHEINLAVTSTLDLRTILDLLLKKIEHFLPYAAGSVLRVLNKDTGAFDATAYRNLDDLRQGGGGLSRITMEQKAPLMIVNALKDPRTRFPEFWRRQGFVSYLAVPLIDKGEALGYIALFTKEEHVFSQEDVEFLTSLAAQAAIAIHNAKSYEDVKSATDRATVLREINLAITSSLNLKTQIDVLLNKISQMFPSYALTVRVANKVTGDFEALACRSLDEADWKATTPKLGGSGLGEVVRLRRAVKIANVQDDPRIQLRDFVRRHGLVSYLGVPLIFQEEVLGTLGFFTREEHDFSDREVEFMTTLAEQVAIAINNSQLYEQVQRNAKELSALHAVASSASQSLDLQTVLRAALQRITDIFAFDATAAYLFNEARDELHVRAAYDDPPDWFASAGTTSFKLGQGIAGNVAMTGEAVVIADILNDPAYERLSRTKRSRQEGRRFIAGFPINYKGGTLGVIMCVGQQPRQLSQNEIQLIGSICNQVAVAIENARLYEQTKQQTDQLRSLATRLDSVREQERSSISREIHDELGQALTALKFDVSWVSGKLSKEEPLISERLSAMSGLLDSTIHAVREISTRLRPDILDKLGLTAAIEWQLQEFRKRTGINYHFASYPTDIRLNEQRSTGLFRILQEALTNVARHSRASRVSIALELQNAGVYLRVDDDGGGIEEDKIFDAQSLGLLGMRERAASLGGSVSVERNYSRGTTVTAHLPIDYVNETIEFSPRRDDL